MGRLGVAGPSMPEPGCPRGLGMMTLPTGLLGIGAGDPGSSSLPCLKARPARLSAAAKRDTVPALGLRSGAVGWARSRMSLGSLRAVLSLQCGNPAAREQLPEEEQAHL
jgi:hypothetical protein